MSGKGNGWVFVTSHGVVLIEVARTLDATVRDIAARADLTERQTHRVLADLVDGGYITRERHGRRNRYRINDARPMRHPSIQSHRIGELLEIFAR